MKLISAFLRLIRVLNLIFIALTQFLFQYFIVQPIFNDAGLEVPLKGINFILLVISSVFIAAAGYIINDYFDLNIDRINKPDKLVVDKVIRRRWAIVWHWFFSLAGLAIGVYLSFATNIFWIVIAHFCCNLALWFYSTTFKKKLLSGNILISLLTAWVVLVIGFADHYKIMANLDIYAGVDRSKLLRLTFLYAGFAFIISLVREVVKDIEDMEGDQKFGCKTMPIAWGIMVSKVFAGTWLVVLLATIIIVFIYMLQLKWWISSIYCMGLIAIPIVQILRKLSKASSPAEYHKVSSMLKFVMFTGILSMIFLIVH
jgi:4-hydroxybenzoate polyprenyltransferase